MSDTKILTDKVLTDKLLANKLLTEHCHLVRACHVLTPAGWTIREVIWCLQIETVEEHTHRAAGTLTNLAPGDRCSPETPLFAAVDRMPNTRKAHRPRHAA